MNKLLESATSSNNYTMYILIAVFVVMLILMPIFNKRRNKKIEAERQVLVDEFKRGTKIITSFGVYGEVVEIKETTDGKVALISTGEGDKKTYMHVHINAIMNVDKKQDVIYDAEGNDITPYEEIDKQNESVEENVEENSKTDEVISEEKSDIIETDEANVQPKETAFKKSSTKKASAKKTSK